MRRRLGKTRRWIVVVALLLVVTAVCGCQTVSFYKQAIAGQYELFAHQESVDKLASAPDTPIPLRDKLRLVQELRQFAKQELKLPVDGHYQKYVDVHRQFVVWNVEAAPEFSLEPKSWWYPVVGRLDYRGYFSKKAAQKYSQYLRGKGYDVYLGGVEAYSTLGWFKDPLLNTFIFEPAPDLAEIIFHELGHQRVFARGDTDFNEAFATTVGQEGARRWLRARGDTNAYTIYTNELRHTDQFVHLVGATRARLLTLYGDRVTEEGKVKETKEKSIPPDHLRIEKERIMNELKEQFAKARTEWGSDTQYDDWFGHEVNNAQLNSVAAYYDLVPAFERLLASNGGDLEKFYEAAERLSKMPKKERHKHLTGS
jgi:predicted aminopeptidase